MGQLTPGTGLLPHYRPVHGPTGWTYAHQAPGGALWREAGEFNPLPPTPDDLTWLKHNITLIPKSQLELQAKN